MTPSASPMGKADLHAHTCHDTWSDGNQTVEEMLAYVEEHTDLDVFAITDHDNPASARAAVDLHRRGRYRFAFLPGVEVTNQSGHMLCYFPSGEVPDIPSLRSFWSTVRYVHRRGGICVAAHPVYPPWLPNVMLTPPDGEVLEGIEVINAGISERAQRRLDGIASRVGESHSLLGNSDAHHQDAVGAAYTEFPGRTLEDFLQALHQRTTRPVFIQRPVLSAEARRFTARRARTRPGWVRNLWREIRP